LSFEDAERELLPRMTGAAATLRAGTRDRKLENGVALEANKIAGALRMETVEEARSIVGKIGERAKNILDTRWPEIERVAKGLLKRGSLSGVEVAVLLTA
jgi:hypothetical protein